MQIAAYLGILVESAYVEHLLMKRLLLTTIMQWTCTSLLLAEGEAKCKRLGGLLNMSNYSRTYVLNLEARWASR